jgi:GntR family transcriptional regulator
MPDPMYRRIADDLQSKIESGEIARGGQLATELELREQYAASRNTVRDAIKWLITRGLVETRPGQGTFVIEKIEPFVTQLISDPTAGGDDEGPVYVTEVQELRKPTASDPRVEVQMATEVIKAQLELPGDSQVVSRHRDRFLGGTPWSLQTSYYPMSLVEEGAVRLIQATNIEEGTVEYLRATLGRSQAGYIDKITVRALNAGEAAFFRLPDFGRIAVLEVLRTAFDEDGRPFRLTVSVYPSDRNEFEVNVGRVPARAGPERRTAR